MLTYDQAFSALQDRGYGPVSARGLMNIASVHGRVTDGTTQVCATNDAGTRFVVRTVTVTSF